MALIAATGKPLPKFIPSFAWFLEGVVTKGFGKRTAVRRPPARPWAAASASGRRPRRRCGTRSSTSRRPSAERGGQEGPPRVGRSATTSIGGTSLMATVQERVIAVTAARAAAGPRRNQARRRVHHRPGRRERPVGRAGGDVRGGVRHRDGRGRRAVGGQRRRRRGVHHQGLPGAGRRGRADADGKELPCPIKQEALSAGRRDRAEPAGGDVRLRPAAADPVRRPDRRVHRRRSRSSSIPQALKTRDIVITDTTFRDGQQARPPYTVEQMVHIYDLLAEAGRPAAASIRQTEFFLYTKNDRETLDRCRELGHTLPRVHRLDPRRQGRLPPGQGGRPQRDAAC